MTDVYVDAGAGMQRIGEVAIWSFDLALWGECTQAATDETALAKFARRTGRTDLTVVERVTRPEQVFHRDLQAASAAEVDTTIRLLHQHRATTIEMIAAADTAGVLDLRQELPLQPAWMPWRTPRAIAEHLVQDAVTGYLRPTGLPTWQPTGDLIPDLHQSLHHLGDVLDGMPRDLVTHHRGETWTAVKLLRRQAWHERIEQVFLRHRLRRVGLPY